MHALFTQCTQPIEEGFTDQRTPSTQRLGFEDILATANTAIDPDCNRRLPLQECRVKHPKSRARRLVGGHRDWTRLWRPRLSQRRSGRPQHP